MLSISEINTFLEQQSLSLAGETISSADGIFYSFVQASFNKRGKRTPSSFQLNKLSKELRKQGVSIHFVLIDGGRDDLDSSLKTCLFGHAPESIRNSYLSIDGKKAVVWVEPKGILSETEKDKIKKSADDFLALFDFDSVSIYFTQTENVPTPTPILRAIHILSPCSTQALIKDLENKNFKIPNEKWLMHHLDKMRKSGQVVRLADGQYILSLKGLSSVGTAKNKNSPDIRRALALAKREG